MAQAIGIKVERSLAGTPTYISFDFKRYGNSLMEFFYGKGLEFPIEDVPNATTIRAMKEAEQGKNLIVCANADDMFNKLGI
ncbi:hypothetical protein FACS189452_03190 [Bacteroidia bacterium]|nr:hypothetical protein FACS189452_03190 [Bacteroidia bacterium]